MGSAMQNRGKCIVIKGGNKLGGTLKIQGSKNAGLPILAATLLTREECILKNCPRIGDVYQMLDIMELIGGVSHWRKDGVTLCSSKELSSDLPRLQVCAMRSSMYLLGALLARNGRVSMNHPGGCVIGKRPIDLHLCALEKMGANIVFENDVLCAWAPGGLKGAEVKLSIPSVGATQNIILAAVTAKGETILRGAAREPEVVSLCRFLNCCGARISGIGQKELVICGVEELHGCEFEIPTDRIVAGTYAAAIAATGSEGYLERAPVGELKAVLDALCKMGAVCQCDRQGLYIQGPKELKSLSRLETEVYPGFPTDLQSVFTTVLTGAKGDCMIQENLFENRFTIVSELKKMGADIVMCGQRNAYIRSGSILQGCSVTAGELRGGAALVVAGIMAMGETKVYGVEMIERGYENICRDLRELGACVYMSNPVTDDGKRWLCSEENKPAQMEVSAKRKEREAGKEREKRKETE